MGCGSSHGFPEPLPVNESGSNVTSPQDKSGSRTSVRSKSKDQSKQSDNNSDNSSIRKETSDVKSVHSGRTSPSNRSQTSEKSVKNVDVKSDNTQDTEETQLDIVNNDSKEGDDNKSQERTGRKSPSNRSATSDNDRMQDDVSVGSNKSDHSKSRQNSASNKSLGSDSGRDSPSNHSQSSRKSSAKDRESLNSRENLTASIVNENVKADNEEISKNDDEHGENFEITKADVRDIVTSVPIATNSYTVEVKLPKSREPNVEEQACARGYAKSKWPIPCFVDLTPNVNVNALQGGGASIILISNAYGGADKDGSNSASEAILFRHGFDGNHMSRVSIATNHEGHFGSRNHFKTDEIGKMYPDMQFGANHVIVLSNIPKYGSLDIGQIVKATDNGQTEFPFNVNGNHTGEYGGGCTLMLCSATEGENHQAGVYMIRCGIAGNHVRHVHIKGDDKWKFDCNESGILVATEAPAQSSYALYHNRENLLTSSEHVAGSAYTAHAQTHDGAQSTCLYKTAEAGRGCMLVMCSHSSGVEDSTVACVYMLSVQGEEVKAELTKQCAGATYNAQADPLWTFTLKDKTIQVTGPTGPCRYAILTNTSRDLPLATEHNLHTCLATGEADPVKGVAKATVDDFCGWVTKRCDLLVVVNGLDKYTILGQDLSLVSGRYAFYCKWSPKLQVGLYNVRIYAVRPKNSDNSPVHIELEGSPTQVIKQPPGLVLAVNCGGQAYHATSDIVYTSEFSQFINLDHGYVFGTRFKPLGDVKPGAGWGSPTQLICNTEDGYLCGSLRTEYAEAVDEKIVIYKIEGITGSDYVLRWHGTQGELSYATLNGNSIAHLLNEQLKKQKHATYTALCVDIPVKVSDYLELKQKEAVGAFALLEHGYADKEKSVQEIDLEALEKKALMANTEPLSRTLTKKSRQIVGWSHNLIENPSATDGLSHWNVSGSWQTREGGKDAEKAFVTSHMRCNKYQEVDLTDDFSAQYLDTAPAIQVFEWYREGVCGGGYYQQTVRLLDEDGQTITEHSPGKTSNLYKNNAWLQEGTTFTGYGPGVRRVTFESSGQDDKHWGGHYGPIISSATVRVKRETVPNEKDAFCDATSGDSAEVVAQHGAARDKLVAMILSEHKDLVEGQDAPAIDELPQQTVPDTHTPRVVVKRVVKHKKREIRVFVSSTFRDFKSEREELIKKTFREINKACKDRGVFFTYVDLRWGITENQTTQGETIAICLQEIDRCRPYFICLMGQRFGWSQKEEKADKLLDSSYDYAVENFPKTMAWVNQFRAGYSVTNLEILHGVLNAIETSKTRSFFYMREPSPSEDKVKGAESEWHAEKQEAFKQRIRDVGELNIRDYSDPLQACEMVKQDLLWCIEQDFPEGSQLTPLERERESHLAFAEARRRVYIGREEYFNEINAYMVEHKPHPLVILGESGSGKSALVANWVGGVEEDQPEAFVFMHFIGSTAESASYIKIIRRLMEEMNAYFGFKLEVPTVDSRLIRELPTWLKMAGTRAKCIIVFDALNQLDDGSGTSGPEHDLLWLPQQLPPGVYMLLSTLPGRAYDAVLERGWPTMHVRPLDVGEKEKIVTGYLEGVYGKTLSAEQKDLIVAAEQTNNPLYLRALLDEVRVFGSFRALTSKIKEYLAAESPSVLFSKILERLEADFEKVEGSREGLVRDTTTALWCSHKGMAEAELVELLNVPNAIWSPMYLSLVDNLVNRNGILNFFHDHLRQAVENKYLPTPEDKKAAFKKLAEFFETQPIDSRSIDELPFLWLHAGEQDKLRATISDLRVFSLLVATEDGKFDLIKFWKTLGEFSEAEKAYMSALKQIPVQDRKTDDYIKLLNSLAEFFSSLGLFQAARTMFEESILQVLEDKYRKSHVTVVCETLTQARAYRCNHPSVIDVLHKLGDVCMRQKDMKASERYYTEAITRQTQVVKPSQQLQLAEGLLGQAEVHFLNANMMESRKYLSRARELATNVLGARHHFVAAIINKLGKLSYKQARTDDALAMFVQDLNLTRADVGTAHPRVASIINDLALVYDDKSLALAGDLYEAALIVLLDTYGHQHLDVAIIRYNLGSFYFATNSFQRAAYQLTEAARVYDMFLGDQHPETQEVNEALKDVQPFL